MMHRRNFFTTVDGGAQQWQCPSLASAMLIGLLTCVAPAPAHAAPAGTPVADGAPVSAPAPAQGLAPLRLADAVRMALAGNAEVLVQQTRIDEARGQQLQAAGQFDVVLASGVNYSKLISSPLTGAPPTSAFATEYQASVSKLLRNGVSAAVTLDDVGNRGGLANSVRGKESKLGVTLGVPLLRGRGARAVTALEDAATLTVQVNRHAYRHQVALVLYQTLTAYWTYQIREALHQAAISSEERSQSLLASTVKLVDAAEKPRADLVLLKADLADKTGARQAAFLALAEARTALGRLLGLDAVQTAALAAPADALPAVGAMRAPDGTQLAQLRADALARRADLHSVAAQIAAAERLAQAASDNLKPRLDLEVGVSYSKVRDGEQFMHETARSRTGPAVVARLNVEFPVQNRSAQGVLLERSAQLSGLQVQQRDLAHRVTSDVDYALQSVLSSAQQLKVAQDALNLYEQAVNQEIVKQKNGFATLIDVINIETRFVNARVNFLQAQLAQATAIARLRLETGTLLPPPVDGAAPQGRYALEMSELAGLGPLARQLAPPL